MSATPRVRQSDPLSHVGAFAARPSSPVAAGVPGNVDNFLQTLPAALYTCDADGRVTFYNEAAAELWGRRPQLGHDLWCGSYRIFHTDGSPMPLEDCPMSIALREGRPVLGRQIVIERPDGVRRHVLPHPRPVLDADGRVTGAVNMLIDITDRHEAQKSGILLAAIVESSDDAIISKTLEGIIVSWNKGAERIFGYTPQEIIGQPVLTLIPPERHDEERDILTRLRRGERIDHYETVRRAKDGRLLDISLSVSPLCDPEGRLIGASNVSRDITAQKRAEQAVRDRENTLRSILALLPVGVYSCDTDGRITFYNRRAVKLWGHEPDLDAHRFCACHRVYALDGTLVPAEETFMAVAARTGRAFRDVEAIVERPDGSRFHASVNIDPIRDESGQLLGALNAFQDISAQAAARNALRVHSEALEAAVAERTAELEATHQRLRLSERFATLGSLSAGLGHDMGNLLMAVHVSLEALSAPDVPDFVRAEVERIRAAAAYLQQLSNGLRLMSSDPRDHASADPLELSDWWSDAGAVVKNTLPSGVQLAADVPGDLWVRISRAALTQIVFNLVQNAGDALRIRASGTVRVSATREHDHVLIAVEDDGPGMSAHVRDRCMEPYFTTKTRGISTGLGLVVVGGLVREAAGTMDVRSEPGLGACFTIRFPAAEAPRSFPSGRARPGRAAVNMTDARLRAYVSAKLRSLDFELAPSDDPDSTSSLDLAVIDGDGPEARALKERARHVVLVQPDGSYQDHESAPVGPLPTAIRAALVAAAREVLGPRPPS